MKTTAFLYKYGLYVLGILGTFLLPIKGLLFMMVFAISFDTVFAVYAAVKNGGWKAFTSTKLFQVVTKSFFYLTAIILGFCVDTFILTGGTVFGISLLCSKTLAALFLYIEVKSIDETNVTKLGNKSFWVLLKELITKVKDVKKDLNGVIEDKKSNDETPEETGQAPNTN